MQEGNLNNVSYRRLDRTLDPERTVCQFAILRSRETIEDSQQRIDIRKIIAWYTKAPRDQVTYAMSGQFEVQINVIFSQRKPFNKHHAVLRGKNLTQLKCNLPSAGTLSGGCRILKNRRASCVGIVAQIALQLVSWKSYSPQI